MKFLVLAAAALTFTSAAAARPEINLHQQCYGNRCVFYAPDGRRVGSVTDYGYNRHVLRNNSGARTGTIVRRGTRFTIRRTFP